MIKIAIVDDDRNMLSIIANNIQQMPEISENLVLDTFTCPKEVLGKLENHMRYDIVISDIEMKEMQGLEFGEIIRRDYPEVYLIYLTAFPHYAVKSYAICAHQYILKEEMDNRLKEVLLDVKKQILKKQKKYRNVAKGKEIYKILYSDIIYIRKVKGAKYVQYMTRHGEYQERISLEQLLEEVPPPDFLMIERGFIVNVDYISSVKGRTIYLENEEMLTISRGKYAQVREKLHTCWRNQL